MAVGILMSHCHNKHTEIVEDPTCRSCYEDEEDLQPVLCECMTLGSTRVKYLEVKLLEHQQCIKFDQRCKANRVN